MFFYRKVGQINASIVGLFVELTFSKPHLTGWNGFLLRSDCDCSTLISWVELSIFTPDCERMSWKKDGKGKKVAVYGETRILSWPKDYVQTFLLITQPWSIQLLKNMSANWTSRCFLSYAILRGLLAKLV